MVVLQKLTILDLQKLTILDLKKMMVKYNLKKVGNKKDLIERIRSYILKDRQAIIIQSMVRGNFVRYFFKLRGLKFNKVNIEDYVNECDFYTLEPLNDINFYDFYGYIDGKSCAYGFNLHSLITLYTKTGQIMNPYNRGNMMSNVILTLHFLNKILFNEMRQSKKCVQNEIVREELLREKTIGERITELFIGIDMLGNYTSSSWFSSLSTLQLVTFYQDLVTMWNYEGNILPETKLLLCPSGNLFSEILVFTLYREKWLNDCVTVMEKLVFSAIDLEDRILGANLVLIALTKSSYGARQQYGHLYESITW
jgi:hypothetical protein